MTTNWRRGACTSMIVALLATTSIARADTVAFARAQATVADNPVRSNVNENESEVRASAVMQGSYVRDGDTIHGSASTSAIAIADYGVLKAGAGGAASNGGEGFSDASSIFSDSFFIDSAGKHGSRGFIHIVMEATWRVVQVVPTSTAQASFRVDLMSADNVARSETIGRPGTLPQEFTSTAIDGVSRELVKPFDGVIDLSIPYTFGDSIGVFAQLSASGSVLTTGPSEGQSASLTFGNYASSATQSAYWGGLSVFDESGNEITDFTLSSTSGTDWRNSFIPTVTPVPEPSTYAMLGIGLLFLAFQRLSSRS